MLGFDGLGLAYMKVAIDKKVILTNIGADGQPYAEPRVEHSRFNSAHFGIRTIILTAAVVPMAAVFVAAISDQ